MDARRLSPDAQEDHRHRGVSLSTVGMISAISNLGQLWFKVFAGRLDTKLLIGFLGLLL